MDEEKIYIEDGGDNLDNPDDISDLQKLDGYDPDNQTSTELDGNSDGEDINKKLLNVIETVLLSKTEDELMGLPIDQIDKILGPETVKMMKDYSKNGKINGHDIETAKRDFVILLRNMIDADKKSGKLSTDLVEVQKKFDEEIRGAVDHDIDVSELIVELCETGKYKENIDRGPEFKLYTRGLKNAGTLDNLFSTLHRYKIKTVNSLYVKSFDISKKRMYDLLSNNTEVTFADPNIIVPTLKMIYGDRFRPEILELFAFIFYMQIDHVRDGKMSLDLITFIKYFLLQMYYLISNNEFKSRELFIGNVEKLLVEIDNSMVTIKLYDEE